MTNPNSTRILKMPTYGLETSPDGQELFLCRYKKPGWRLRLDDAATDKTKLNGVAEGATKVEASTAGKIKINGTDTTVVDFATDEEVTEMLNEVFPAAD